MNKSSNLLKLRTMPEHHLVLSANPAVSYDILQDHHRTSHIECHQHPHDRSGDTYDGWYMRPGGGAALPVGRRDSRSPMKAGSRARGLSRSRRRPRSRPPPPPPRSRFSPLKQAPDHI